MEKYSRYPYEFIELMDRPENVLRNLISDDTTGNSNRRGQYAIQKKILSRRDFKTVWMLQDDEGGHAHGNPAHKLDFTICQQQSFNHYLKKQLFRNNEKGIP